MASILLKNIPTRLHSRLKKQAATNGRSMNQEAQRLLEESLHDPLPPLPRRLPKPFQLRDPRTGRPHIPSVQEVVEMIREDRE